MLWGNFSLFGVGFWCEKLIFVLLITCLMKVFVNRILPVGRHFGAMNLFGILFVKPDVEVSPRLLNHEEIHSRQMRELLWLPFYVLYVTEWVVRLVQCGMRPIEAYRRISFEREAYRHEGDLGYLGRRRRFAMWRR